MQLRFTNKNATHTRQTVQRYATENLCVDGLINLEGPFKDLEKSNLKLVSDTLYM